MGVLLPDGSVPQGMPAMPGAGIVPAAPAQYNFAPPAQVAAPAPEQPGSEFVPGKGSKVGGILSTLLGWKHQEEVQKRHERVGFLQSTIHEALTNPNSRLPEEYLNKYIGELGKNLESGQAPGVGKLLKDHAASVYQSRDLAKKVKMASQAEPVGQAPPVMPGQAPQQQASPPQQPPGLPQPPSSPQAAVPFGGGAGNSAEPAPLQGESPAALIGARAGGSGFGPPPPAAPSHILSLAAMATQKAQADIASQRVMMQFGQERVSHAMEMLKAMGRDPSKLNDTQIASFITNGMIPAPDWHDIARGAIGVQNTGGGPTIISGQQEPTPIPVGGGLYQPPPVGGAPPGVPWRPGQAPAAGGQAPALNAMQSPPVGIAAPQPVASGAGPMGSVSRNPDGSSVISGGPPIDPKQRTANLAWEAKHGRPITADKYGEALSELGESAITPTTRAMNESLVANRVEQRKMRQIQEAHLRQTMREFDLTKGPQAIDKLAGQVHENPDLLQKLSGDVYNLVSQRYEDKYQTPPPKPIPAELKNREDASFIALNNVNRINELLKNPVIQQRMGVWGGNLGNLEQALGTTVGLSDQDARDIQAFRSSVNYLFAQEAKSIFSGRPPQKLMDEIKASSPKMKMGLPLFQGAMDAVKATGENNLKTADDVRFNRKPALTPMPEITYHDGPDTYTIPKEKEARFLQLHPNAKRQ